MRVIDHLKQLAERIGRQQWKVQGMNVTRLNEDPATVIDFVDICVADCAENFLPHEECRATAEGLVLMQSNLNHFVEAMHCIEHVVKMGDSENLPGIDLERLRALHVEMSKDVPEVASRFRVSL